MKIVIFAGGYGTRMWPASRKSFPKQFYPVIRGKSFFQQTVARFKKKYKSEDIYVSTEDAYVKLAREQAPDIPAKNYIVEPERRDLLGAVGLVAAVIDKHSPGSVMFFSWSDHFINEEEEFLRAVQVAGDFCKETGRPVSLNERPTFPSTAHGWVQMGKKVDTRERKDLYQIQKHVEKPDLKTAKKYFKDDTWLIHTGYGAWRSDLMLSYYEKYRPSEHEGLLKIQETWGTDSERKVLEREYGLFEKISVEYGLFEKLPNDLRLTIPISVGWEDVGTWKLFFDAMKEGNEKNVIEGGAEAEFVESEGNLVYARRGKLVGIVGMNSLVVIDTDDALLVVPMDKTEKVKQMFKKIETEKSRYVE
ncbi:hypothetical protein A2630_04435 [Candidatus Woesebacteria bacterium RIFCSPHIGHO2_01_FULL_44_10]|uniref:Nucleotidyl transferase domain-containing protein n=1 Tax=Candidatus Woesebacteria bacterium RIFCSPLOWO2_01_FULL_44_14 TaxID=1802525 RepID=A0A1F8C3L2_9BACT|nr:MAG: hypothetical protein A2630_04435 [Candidatus Woesebacteria bacterium RIFCSPHIGHO2_01_FULL_44_10]OGM56028.1 MAG: hypothetical protein A3F62_03860 [Candidatus Woesebacteria bacterium RIFCSPHIGHO2_12_FULL_44_11]OGM70750.1 MAG: hypothetical protein A2975_02570 [Candidatus Woesebacteria bacterium RIFCSPLOWO2_01_FULL_44_14]